MVDHDDRIAVSLDVRQLEGRTIAPPKAPEPTRASDLLEALRQSAGADEKPRSAKRKPAAPKPGKAAKPKKPAPAKTTKNRKAA
jgi:DNA end-binding protein Ku